MHILAYHVPRFLKQDLAFKRFTGQGIEKINDCVRSIYHKKCNKHDACSEALLALKRMDRLQDFERTANQYRKRNQQYWDVDIFEQRRKKKRISVEPRADIENCSALANSQIDIYALDAKKIRQKLAELGIKTKVRNIDKLRTMLKDNL